MPRFSKKAILAELTRLYPDAGPELKFTNPYETLVAVMLSAQCTDKMVNKVTPAVFERYPDVASMAAATVEELSQKLATGRADPAAARDELLHTMACKSAIKAGMTSDAKELQALVEKVQAGEILYCPHGRPVKHKLSKYEIEKLFKRA